MGACLGQYGTLRQKWGGAICLNIQCVVCIHPLPCSSQSLTHKVDSLEERRLAKRVLSEINDAFVDTKPRGIEATCIVVVTGDDLV